MAFLGLFKTEKERILDEVIDSIIQVQGMVQELIPLIESELDAAQRKEVAKIAIILIMRTPLTSRAVDALVARVKSLTSNSNRQLDFLGSALASCLLRAWISASVTPKFREGIAIQVSIMEGSVLGFVERTGFPGWTPCYSIDASDILEMRRSYLLRHGSALGIEERADPSRTTQTRGKVDEPLVACPQCHQKLNGLGSNELQIRCPWCGNTFSRL